MDTIAASSPARTRSGPNRIAVASGAEPGDWQTIHDRIDSRPAKLTSTLVNVSAAAATFLGLFATIAMLASAIWWIYPDTSAYYMACFVVPPGFLVGAAAGQAGGNVFLRLWFGLDDATRRGFATRLTLGRAPGHWPGAVRRWLFSGDWLGAPACDMRLPYVRIFALGAAPATCREEDELWREIHGTISGDSTWEAGCNHREISYPQELPAWVRQVNKGDGVEALQKRIGRQAASDWVAHLWRRACRQWPALGDGSLPDAFRRDCFEIHSLALSRGREALVVVLRPTETPAEAEIAENKVAAA